MDATAARKTCDSQSSRGLLLTGDDGSYRCKEDVWADFQLMFANCYEYNDPADDIYQMAREAEVRSEGVTGFCV